MLTSQEQAERNQSDGISPASPAGASVSSLAARHACSTFALVGVCVLCPVLELPLRNTLIRQQLLSHFPFPVPHSPFPNHEQALINAALDTPLYHTRHDTLSSATRIVLS